MFISLHDLVVRSTDLRPSGARHRQGGLRHHDSSPACYRHLS